MGEPRAITGKEVAKASGDNTLENWRKVGEISGAGHVPFHDDASIDLTDVSEAKRAQIDRLMGAVTEEAENADAVATKKKGDK